MLIKFKSKLNKGMGLIEVLIAVTMSVIALTAMVSMVVTALRSSLQSRMYLEATKLAGSQIERVRVFRDGNTWDDFLTQVSGCYDGGGNKCSFSPTMAFSSASAVSEHITYYFYVTDTSGNDLSPLPNPLPGSIRVTAIASWDNDSKNTTMITDLSNWQDR